MKSDGKVVISTALDNNGLEKGIQSISGSFGGLKSVLSKLTGLITTAFSVKSIVQFGTEASKTAMQLSSAMTGLQSIVKGQGRSFSDAQAFIEEYINDGLIPATNAVTAYKNLAMRGYDDSQIKQTMIALKNASAFGRQASMTMGEAVQSATEGLKNENSILVDNAGVTKNVSKMWEEYAASIGTTAAKLTQQQKIQAEVNGILEESKYQSGDAAKVAGTLSGQLQQLSFNFNNLKVAIGNAINPIVQSVLPVINTVIAKMTKLANSIATVIGSIFGKVTVQTESIADAANSAADAENDLASGITAAAKAAKKSLSGFDELNILQSDTGSDTGLNSGLSSGVSDRITTGTVTVNGDIQDNITPKIEALVEKIKGFGKKIKTVFQPSITAWGTAFSNLAPTMESAGARISTAWTNLKETSLKPFWEYITTSFVPGITNTFSTTFAPIFADVMPASMSMWATDFENQCLLISKITDDVLKPAFEGVQTAYSDMCESLTENWNKHGGGILKGLQDFKTGMWDTFWSLYDHVIKPVFDSIGTAVGNLWNEHLKPAWEKVNGAVMSIAENVLILYNNVIKPIVDAVVAYLAPLVLNVFGNIVDYMRNAIASIAGWVSAAFTAFDGIVQFLAGVFTLDWERAWGGIKKIFSGAWEGIKTTIKTVINGIIWMLNTLWSGIYSSIASVVNGLSSIAESAGDILGKNWGFSMPTKAPKIPYLAQGAVLPPNKPFMAIVGDQKHGTNVEAPLSTIQEAVAVVMQDFISSNMAGHEATVAVLREILEAVLGIQIGDDVIYTAVERYRTKMAIVKGG